MKTKQQIQERIKQLNECINNIENYLKDQKASSDDENKDLIKLLYGFKQRVSALEWALT